MITISLTVKQYQACRHWAAPRHLAYLLDAENDGKKRKVTMPYPGWRSLTGRLARQAFDRWGRVQRTKLADDKAGGTVSALYAISRELAKQDGHPAMRGEIVLGYSAERFVVWPTGDTPTGWSLAPTRNGIPYALNPVFESDPVATIGASQMRLREGVTYWRPTALATDPTDWLGWELVEEESQAAGT